MIGNLLQIDSSEGMKQKKHWERGWMGQMDKTCLTEEIQEN